MLKWECDIGTILELEVKLEYTRKGPNILGSISQNTNIWRIKSYCLQDSNKLTTTSPEIEEDDKLPI